MGFENLRLSTRITLSALVLVGLGAVVLMFFEEARLRDLYVAERRADMTEALQTNNVRLIKLFDELRRDTLFLAEIPPVAGIIRAAGTNDFDFRDGNTREKWNMRLQEIFSAFLATHPDYYQASFVGVADGGRELVRVVRREGRVEIVAPKDLETWAGRPYFEATRKRPVGSAFLSAFDLHRRGGEANGQVSPVLHATATVHAPDGRLFGMVAISMVAERMFGAVSANLPRGALAYLSDREGRYLLHPDRAPLPGIGSESTRRIDADFPAIAALLDARTPAHFPLQPISTEAGTQYLAAERIHFDSDNPGRFLVLAYRVPGDLNVEDITRIPAQRIVAGFAALALVCAVVFVVLRRTFAPLGQLTHAAGEIASGKRDLVLPRAGSGEIGSLTRAISSMLAELRLREQEISRINAGLEQQVAQRTAELAGLVKRNEILKAASLEGIHVLDVAGNVLEVNEAFCRMLGYTRVEALRLNVGDWEAVTPLPQILEGLPKRIGQSWMFETRHRRKDGSLIDVEISCCGAEIGGRGYLYCASRDITERKRAELVLRQHKIIIDTARDGFWLTDATGLILEANESYADISGYAVDELVGMHVSRLDARMARHEQAASYIERMIARGGHGRFETRHLHKDGHEIDVEVSATWMPESHQVSVFCRDITRRKQAEQGLRIAAAAFETHDAIVITDARGDIVRVNRAFTRITGYGAEEVVGRNPRVMQSGHHDRSFYAEMWDQILATGSWAGEIMDRRKNGEVYPQWLTITAVRGEGEGAVTHYVGIFSDITLRKQAEQEIRNLAFYDALTQLPNRRLFFDRARAVQHASARHADFGALLFIDMDRFKSLNDTLGHDHGDLMLIEVAERLKACVREMDTVARLGGDEFVVLLQSIGTTEPDAFGKAGLVAEKIREALARPYRLKEHEHSSSPSIGVALIHGKDEPVEVLLQRADMAMYEAKRAGRNAVRFYDASTATTAVSRMQLEAEFGSR